MSKFILYKTGDKIGDCTFLRDIPKLKSGNRMAIFLCRCGNEFEGVVRSVKKSDTKGCKECASKSRAKTAVRIGTKHGMSSSKEYLCYLGVKKRCLNENAENYIYYGGRGIKMCDRWVNSFEDFLSDMGKMPSNKHSIERIDVDGDYEPSNCKWILLKDQYKNRRSSKYITYKGERKLISDWEKILEFPNRLLYRRVFRLKWSIERAITTPVLEPSGANAGKPRLFPIIKYSFGFINA